MSKVFTYVRNNENNHKYTQEQRSCLKNYLEKNNITDFKNIEINISTPNEEKNILEETASTVAEKVRKTRRNYHKKENYKQAIFNLNT